MCDLNIVVPMAGAGSRFAKSGYERPKPLIDIHGKHMIELVINNLTPSNMSVHFIFVCQERHFHDYGLQKIFSEACDSFDVICINGITEGAACTVLKAKDLINKDIPLMIANSDQWCDFDIDAYLKHMAINDLDGSMLTMKANDPKWSYAKIGENGLVAEVVEKVVVSDEATVGIYNYKSGTDFVRHAEQMIEKKLMSNGEYYVAPVYTLMAEAGAKIDVFNIGTESNGMYGLGIPEDLEYFLTLDISKKAIDF